MEGLIESIIETLARLPPLLLYVAIGVGAALENIVPPIPADTFVLLGAFLAAAGHADLRLVFACTLVPNVLSATLTYWLARRYGTRFFGGRVGRWLLNERQLEHIAVFYERWGTPAILVSRFLPALRAVVPVFAGVTGVSVPRLIIPLTIASAAWYGALVYLGGVIGRNWHEIMTIMERASGWLMAIAALVIGAISWWWLKTRRDGAR